MVKSQCKAEFHSEDGKDSLPFSSSVLFCLLEEGHKGNHKYFGGYTN